jgi:hypothetical protein
LIDYNIVSTLFGVLAAHKAKHWVFSEEQKAHMVYRLGQMEYNDD